MSKILLIDDDADVREYLKVALLALEQEIIEADDGYAALRKLESDRVDLILCDLYMPGMEGLETIREIKRLYKDIPVIAISGGSLAPDFLPVASCFGVAETLYKPIMPDVLSRLVDTYTK